MTENWLRSGDEPALSRQAHFRLTGMEPGLSGSTHAKADQRLVLELLDDGSEEWYRTINQILDAGLGRVYALELIKIIALGSRRRRRGGMPVGYNTAQRIAATRALEVFGHEVAVHALIAVLGDVTAWWVGQYAVQALIAIGSPATGALVEALSSPDPIVRRRVADVLGQIGDFRAVEPLIALLEADPVGWVRARAVRSLGFLRARQSIGVLLVARRNDEDELVRRYAFHSLSRMGIPVHED